MRAIRHTISKGRIVAAGATLLVFPVQFSPPDPLHPDVPTGPPQSIGWGIFAGQNLDDFVSLSPWPELPVRFFLSNYGGAAILHRPGR